MEPTNPLLDDFVFALTGKRKPRVCFLPTASGDAETYIKKFYWSMPAWRCRASHLCLFAHNTKNPRRFLLQQDVIYVGGGNTANMLAIWRVQGIDKMLREAWKHGVVLCGVSAGANCWFEGFSTDSFGGFAPLKDGLGFIAGSVCPHYDSEKNRRRTFHRVISSGQLSAGFAMDDGAAVHFIGRRFAEAVSSRPQARVYRVVKRKGRIVEQILPTRYLGDER
jgi:peptidase E